MEFGLSEELVAMKELARDFAAEAAVNAYMFIAGPPLVKAVVHEDATKEELGGPRLHARSAVNILFRKEIAAADNPEQVRQEKLEEFYNKFVNPLYSAGLQHVDDIVDPRRLRPNIIRALELSMTKRDELPKKKHGNMPI